MAKITLDYNFAVSRNVEGGITPEGLETLLEKARYGFSKLTELIKTKKVGFPALPYQDVEPIKAMAKEIYRKYNDLVVVGIGGSALGVEAIAEALLPLGYNSLSFSDRRSFPRLWILDNSDPSRVGSVMRYCKPEDTFVLVISKSGQTIETAANFALVMDWMKKAAVDIKKHVAVITDPVKGPLNAYAKESGLALFPIEPSIGGRYSVLSPVGLLPAAILGIDIDQLLAGAASVVESDWKQFLVMTAVYMHYMKTKPINILMPYSSRLPKFAEWFGQLWGESLGKLKETPEGVVNFGTTAVRSYGAVDQHSQLQLYLDGPEDKFITFIGVNTHELEAPLPGGLNADYDYFAGKKLGELLNIELKATEAALVMKGRPSMRLDITNLSEASLGELFMLFQHVVAIIGLAEGIDPFDQPAVESGKQFVYGLTGKEGFGHKKEQFDQVYTKSSEFIVM